MIPPDFEALEYESTREMLRYVCERTDIALGLFNTHAAGWILTPDECARLVDEFPAICAVKNGMFRPTHSAALHRLVPELVIWESDMLAYRGGFSSRDHRCRHPRWLGLPLRAARQPDLQRTMGSPRLGQALRGDRSLVRVWPRRAGGALHGAFGASNVEAVYTHWGSAFKAAAHELGLPVGSYDRSRPPQPPLPEAQKAAIRDAYTAIGLIS